MHRPHKTCRVFHLPRCRTARGYRRLLTGLLAALILPAAACSMVKDLPFGGEEEGPIVHLVEKGDFIHDITERGNVESASNIEIRCEVQALNSQGTMILEIVPEGTYVEPGDVLAKLDSSSLENQQTQQQIVCNSSEAALIQATNDYETALIAKREYLEGKYAQEEQTIESEIFVAKEELRQAEQNLEYSKRLAAKGYVTPLQLEADRFAVDNAEKKLESAETKLRVLQEFTKAKMVKQLGADIKTTEAKRKEKDHTHQLDMEKLALIESQIEKCIIKAPQSGQVVYANVTNRHGGSDIIIEEGILVRERQVIIRLPDPKRMQVKAKINEAKVAMVEEGMPVVIRLDAFPDLELEGSVQKVNEYPAPTGWFSANVKEYETTIHIEQPPEALRPGLTAEVKIRVEQSSDVLHVPVQTVFEHGGKHYCVLRDGQDWTAREIRIGSTNDKTVIVEAGLEGGEEVVMGAAAYRDRVDLPELPSESEAKGMLANGRPAGRPRPEPAGGEQSGAPGTSRRPGPGESARPGPGASGRGPRTPGGSGPGGSGRPDPATIVSRMLQQMDKNSNGRLDKDEIPEAMQSRLAAADTNGDGAIDRAELTAAMSRAAGRGPAARPSPGASP